MAVLRDFHFWLRSVLACADHLFREYIQENEFKKSNILTILSGVQMGSIHEEKSQNLVTLPF